MYGVFRDPCDFKQKIPYTLWFQTLASRKYFKTRESGRPYRMSHGQRPFAYCGKYGDSKPENFDNGVMETLFSTEIILFPVLYIYCPDLTNFNWNTLCNDFFCSCVHFQ